MATIQDIADKLGVSKGTVSKAINTPQILAKLYEKQFWIPPSRWDTLNSGVKEVTRRNSALS